MTYDGIIIGGGPGGYTAALYAARSGLDVLVLEKLSAGGQMALTSQIDNYPGFPEGVDGFELGMKFQEQAERFGAKTEYAEVRSLNLRVVPRVISTSEGDYFARTVVIATGAKARYLGLEGESELIGHGLTACATCDGAFYRDVPVCVVGGGDSACEEANFLTRFASKVYLIHRRDQLRASKAMQQRTLETPKVEPVWNSTIAAYHTDDKGELSGLTLRNTQDGSESELEVKCVFMAIGHTPVSNFAGDLVERDAAGFVVTSGAGTATKTPGLFAAGDVADPTYRQAISAAGMGCRAAMDAERYLLTRE